MPPTAMMTGTLFLLMILGNIAYAEDNLNKWIQESLQNSTEIEKELSRFGDEDVPDELKVTSIQSETSSGQIQSIFRRGNTEILRIIWMPKWPKDWAVIEILHGQNSLATIWYDTEVSIHPHVEMERYRFSVQMAHTGSATVSAREIAGNFNEEFIIRGRATIPKGGLDQLRFLKTKEWSEMFIHGVEQRSIDPATEEGDQ